MLLHCFKIVSDIIKGAIGNSFVYFIKWVRFHDPNFTGYPNSRLVVTVAGQYPFYLHVSYDNFDKISAIKVAGRVY